MTFWTFLAIWWLVGFIPSVIVSFMVDIAVTPKDIWVLIWAAFLGPMLAIFSFTYAMQSASYKSWWNKNLKK